MSYQLNPLLLEDSPLYIPINDKNKTLFTRTIDSNPGKRMVVDTPTSTAREFRRRNIQHAFSGDVPLTRRSSIRVDASFPATNMQTYSMVPTKNALKLAKLRAKKGLNDYPSMMRKAVNVEKLRAAKRLLKK